MDDFSPEFRQKYVRSVEGQDYISYTGLLHLAHDKIRSIDVVVLQFPLPENGGVAVVRAVIEDTEGRRWVDIGDAGDDTCVPELVAHKIRLASTRAKGRALRDMLCLDAVMYEEIYPDRSPAVNSAAITGANNEMITSEQGNRITQILHTNNIPTEAARELLVKHFGKDTLSALTVSEADLYIETLLRFHASKQAS